MKTLIIAPNWIGDALMAQPLLALEKRLRPAQSITVLAPRWVAPVFDAMPEVDDVIPTDLTHGRLQWRHRQALARQLRARGFDRAYVLPNSLKAALIPWLAGIPQRVGYRGEMRYGLLNRRLPDPPEALPMAQRYAALLQPGDDRSLANRPDTPDPTQATHAESSLGTNAAAQSATASTAALPSPRLVVAEQTIRTMLQRFALRPGDRQDSTPGSTQAGPLIALCPGAEFGPAKRWPTEHFAELCRLLRAALPDCRLLLMGGPGDREMADAIAAQAGVPVVNLAGQTALEEAMALLAAADAVVSNDSGLMHVAAALGRPQVAVFGSSDPRHTPPLSPKATVLWLHLECSPCFARVCPLGHLRCLKDITPGQVLETLRQILAAASSAATQTATQAAPALTPQESSPPTPDRSPSCPPA